jgi:hypothetical protein
MGIRMVSMLVPKGYEQFKKTYLARAKALAEQHLKEEETKVRDYVR